MAMRRLLSVSLALLLVALLPTAALGEEPYDGDDDDDDDNDNSRSNIDHQRRGEVIWTAGASEAIQEAFMRNQLLMDDQGGMSCEERPLSARFYHNAGFASALHGHIASLLLAMSINRTLASPVPGQDDKLLLPRSKCFSPSLSLKEPQDLLKLVFNKSTQSYDVQGDAESHVIVFEQYKLRGLFGQLPPENHELWESVFARGQFKMVTYENGTSAPMERLLQPHELSMADRAFFMYAEAASFLFKPAASVIKTAVSALPKDLSKKITEKSEITTLDDLKSACRSKDSNEALFRASIHMRTTDKSSEDPFFKARKHFRSGKIYWEAAREVLQRMNHDPKNNTESSSIFIMSDNLDTAKEFAKLPQADGWHPVLDSGDRKVQMRRHTHYNKNKDLHERHLRHFLAQVTLAGYCSDYIVMTGSSNVGRFIIELIGSQRRISGAYGIQTSIGVSLDFPWLVTGHQISSATTKAREAFRKKKFLDDQDFGTMWKEA